MLPAPKPDNEERRLRALRELEILETQEEEAFDELTFIASQICRTPIALVSLVDENRQWFKSHHGLDARETPRDLAFCAHAILQSEVLIVPDSEKDLRFHDNPLVVGEPRVKFYAGAPLTMAGGLRLGTLCVIDRTPRNLDPDQIRSLEALASQVVAQIELRVRVRELMELSEFKDQFIATVNHELRTPLTSIIGALTLVGSGKVGDAQRSKLEDSALRNSQRLLQLVNDILDIAKLESDQLELQPKTVDLVELARQAIQLNAPFAERFKCRCLLRPGPERSEVRADSSRILQVLTNLLSNATKFSGEGDDIVVAIAEHDGRVRVSVEDHGPGIPEEFRSRIFGKFCQAKSARSGKQSGTGLGLNISKRIVELHGGTIGFESTLGAGTTFYFELPASRATADEGALALESVQA